MRLIALGNCVAEKLSLLLAGIFEHSFFGDWQVELTPPVFNLSPAELPGVAEKALACDVVFSQPLFNFGPCNTSILREKLGSRLHTFSAPNFEAYFPDVMDIRPLRASENFSPPLEWHSSIIARCKAAGVPVEEAEKVYLNHPLFGARSVKSAIERTFETYGRREKDVEIGTLSLVREQYAFEPLFHTWNHPGDRILKRLLAGMLKTLGLDQEKIDTALARIPWRDNDDTWSSWGFGFNSWPIIARGHKLFSFPGREWSRVAGKKIDLLTFIIAWYNYYDAHPLILEQALEHAARNH